MTTEEARVLVDRLEVGDTLVLGGAEVKVVKISHHPSQGFSCVTGEPAEAGVYDFCLARQTYVTVRRERPIKVGDTVRLRASTWRTRGEVLAVHKAWAWVKFEVDTTPGSWTLDTLEVIL